MPTPLPAVGRAALAAAVLAGLCLGAAGCSSTPSGAAGEPPTGQPTRATTAPARPVALPPAGAPFDYQLGGAYPPPAGVRVLSRDRGDRPAPGRYTVCYVNAFQAQPDAVDWWRADHPDLLLHDREGHLVMDPDWNEPLLDTSTPARRDRLAALVGGWIDGCARAGFQAVEPDNLDSFERSRGLLSPGDNTALARLLVRRAHADRLAIAQKNTSELLPVARGIGFDFAVTEDCAVHDDCAGFASAYGDHVLDVEYTDRGFTAACAAWRGRLSVVRRDLDVSPAGSDGYVFRDC